MTVLQAFGETGYTLFAVVLPLALTALMSVCWWLGREVKRDTRRSAQAASSSIGAVAAYGVGGIQGFILGLFQLILVLLLLLNVILVTVPYGRSRGLW